MINNEPIRAFNIDFNWDNRGLARPGMYAHANPSEHLQWYKELGVNTIQTFCVTANGYAWYPSNVAPPTPGLTRNFLGDLTQLGHAEGMAVLGYFCLGANPYWEGCNRELVGAADEEVGHRNIPFTEEYLSYFCRSVEDTLLHTEVDGFMIDWFRPTGNAVLEECEKQMYRELMNTPFHEGIAMDSPEMTEFHRRTMERAWVRIKETVEATRPVVIWTNHPFFPEDKPVWTGHRLLKEVDWVLNEGSDMEILHWLTGEIGPEVKVIQNLCGWRDHDASSWERIDRTKFGLYGFAQADPVTTFPSDDYTPACFRNTKNIEVIRRLYHQVGS